MAIKIYRQFKKLIKKKFFLQTPDLLFINKKNKINSCMPNKIIKLGNKNKNKIFYVIKRTPGTGLFSNVLFVLNHLNIAIKKKYIPIVDMQNFTTIYNEPKKINGNHNAWEYYFKNLSNYKLKDIYQSQKVIFTDNKYYSNFVYDLEKNKKLINLFQKKIKVKKDILRDFKYFKKKIDNEKVLGIHFRGTSYKRSPGHPFPSTKKQMGKIVDNFLKKKKFTKIFLATEEKDYLNFFIKRYGNKIIYLKDVYRSNKNDAFKIYPRKNHRYKLGREIILETMLMSATNYFIFVNSNVSSASIAFNINKRQKRVLIDNGYNSKNQFFAQWLWYFRKLLPDNLWGFKIKLKYI